MRTVGVDERLRPRSSNHLGMRRFDEHVVQHAVRLNGSLPWAEIAGMTNLTVQTVQRIMNRLEADRLVLTAQATRGKVGQACVPMALNSDGSFAIGVKIGRRSANALLVNFTAQVRQRLTLPCDLHNPYTRLTEIDCTLRELARGFTPALRSRLTGVGVAAALSLNGWHSPLGLASEQARSWSSIDIRERVAALANLPVACFKDTSAACEAGLVSEHGRNIQICFFVFAGPFIGRGLVLDRRWCGGLNGNAGAVGPLSMGLPSLAKNRVARGAADAHTKARQPPAQLMRTASLFKLETLFIGAVGCGSRLR